MRRGSEVGFFETGFLKHRGTEAQREGRKRAERDSR
jgi:hypothetical protein